MSNEASFRTETELRAWAEGYLRNDEERAYFELHAPRYLRALAIVRELLPTAGEGPPSLCDVAPHLLSELFASATAALVNTVGVRFLPKEASHRQVQEHMDLDLNSLHSKNEWRSFHLHDVVFMGEIIEHLHAAPAMVLGCVSRWVKPGGFLVIQTPNAVSLTRRLAMILGRHPYEMIHPGNNPGHIREYTGPELTHLAQSLGLHLTLTHYENYFRPPHRRGLRGALFHAATRVPATLREGMTLVFRKPANASCDSLPSKRLHGHIEFMGVYDDGQFHVVGWILDHEQRLPIPSLELHSSSGLLATTVPNLPRPDVAASFHDQALASCGFHFTLDSKAVPPNTAPFFLLARDRFGDLLRLPRP
ncbi:MAG TPA: methyltransferase domain-containing protein [Planctomycetota bacterium]|jgi:hypothetical protein|nr:methyltransferase domain-containing protein [Planctomycetota bacterium]